MGPAKGGYVNLKPHKVVVALDAGEGPVLSSTLHRGAVEDHENSLQELAVVHVAHNKEYRSLNRAPRLWLEALQKLTIEGVPVALYALPHYSLDKARLRL